MMKRNAIETTCQSCGQKNLVSDSADPAPPTPGAFSICANCCALSRFDENLATRLATPADLDECGPQTLADILAMQAAVQLSKELEKRRN